MTLLPVRSIVCAPAGTSVLAELPSDPGIRLLGELVDTAEAHVGMAVQPQLGIDADQRPVLTFAPVDRG